MAASAGCWTDDSLIDGAFTPDQWTHLQQQLELRPLTDDGCGALDTLRCGTARTLAAQLFSDATLSGSHCSSTTSTVCFSQFDCPAPETCLTPTPVSCQSCHDPNSDYVDTRSTNNVSQAAVAWTSRNAMTLMDIAYKSMYAPGGDVYTWTGGAKLPGDTTVTHFTTAGSVLDLAIRKPMSSTRAHVMAVVMGNPQYAMAYLAAFGSFTNVDHDFANLETAFTAYFASQPFLTRQTPFDLYLQGRSDVLSDSAKHGFALFVGKGTCIECHNNAMFSDYDFHDTGVEQTGDHVPATDLGRGAVTTHSDDGKFLTGTLREIAKTGPYFHDGKAATLGEVIDFYRRGGDAVGTFSGTRDPRIQPLDLTDQDAVDLEAFLTSLTQCDSTTCPAQMMPSDGGTIGDSGGPACHTGETSCPMGCVNVQTDFNNCGRCGNACMAGTGCIMGMCGPDPCPMPLIPCGAGPMCVDPTSDINNCGACGHACMATQVCYQGNCM